ncbi:MAG TPA: transposase [Gaiellaceae bacterium]|nr:transposase [Gaiellaceae bacterium]
MGRAPRPLVRDGVYHATTRGVRGLPIVLDDDDRAHWLSLLGYVVRRHDWICSAFCLMTNHWHAVVQTPNADISAGIHRLNGIYARYLNDRHGLAGHVFERRFNSTLVESDRQLAETARYVELNPVRAGICDDPTDWPWSSHAAAIGAARPPRFLDTSAVRAVFSTDDALARQRYRAFVLDRLLEPDQPKPYSPANRSASRRTRSAAGSPTTLR